MPHRILAAIRSQPWAMLPDYLEAIEGIALRLSQNPALDLIAEDGHADRHEFFGNIGVTFLNLIKK